MTPEAKLDLALRSYEAFSAGPDIDALIPLYDPACEWTIGSRVVDTPAVYHEHDGLREFAAWFGEWVSFLQGHDRGGEDREPTGR